MPPGFYKTNCAVMPRRRTRVMRVAGSQNELQQGGLAVLQNEMPFRGLRRNYKAKCRGAAGCSRYPLGSFYKTKCRNESWRFAKRTATGWSGAFTKRNAVTGDRGFGRFYKTK